MSSIQNCLLSIIVTVVGGPPFLQKCLSCLVPQVGTRTIEIIVPYLGYDQEIQILQREFNQVVFLKITVPISARNGSDYFSRHDIYDRGKSQGISIARGQLIALIDDQGIPASDWCDRVIESLQLPHGVVGGAIEHSGKGILNWAVYFTDFGRYQLPLQEGPTNYLSDINIYYKQSALDAVRETWAEKYNEVGVNWTLLEQGVVLWLNPKLVVQLDRGDLNLTALIQERFTWGRIFGSIRTGRISTAGRIKYLLFAPAIPGLILFRAMFKVFAGKRNREYFIWSAPFILFLAIAWVFGEWVGYFTGR